VTLNDVSSNLPHCNISGERVRCDFNHVVIGCVGLECKILSLIYHDPLIPNTINIVLAASTDMQVRD
jgi:hypothetical protein